MNFKRMFLPLAFLLTGMTAAHADEGMWLLQMLKEQQSIELMKRSGLHLEADDLYNPDSLSLKDVVGIFGGGCTGEIVSPRGLILTNHHCGFAYLQQLSSVEQNYLEDGFWAHSEGEEIPAPGLTFTFVERIVDLTDTVARDIRMGKTDEIHTLTYQYCDSLGKAQYAQSDLQGKPGIRPEVLPYFAGNRYYLVYYKVYSDVRLVAAPPRSIGKFGGETDNWMWPRHTGDFSMFRIYADKNGEPAAYSANNVPLQTKKHLPVSIKGYGEGDYAMVMGFPGSTSRYLTAAEVKSRMDNENTPRITVRGARQAVLKKYMAQSDSLNLMYANKYASSSNYWKNSIGMNKAIVKNRIIEKKQEQEARFARYADSVDNADYREVVARINQSVEQNGELDYAMYIYLETFGSGIEFCSRNLNEREALEQYLQAKEEKDEAQIENCARTLENIYGIIHNTNYSHEVDRAVADTLIPLYKQLTRGELPSFYAVIDKDYKGNISAFLDDLYGKSIFASRENFEAFLRKPRQKAIDHDLALLVAESLKEKSKELNKKRLALPNLALLHKTYIRGLCEMNGRIRPQYPDANFTLRLTYGNVKPYSPADGVKYEYYTTLRGVMEKEDPSNPEFIVPQELKVLYQAKDYGRYADRNGEMPVCFLSTNDITGGNSGSPVINADGQLIGAAFDGNWESLSGDIQFDNDLQRCICVDVRYILFLIEKLGKCSNLIEEMTIVE
ncbi:MAG: S46 family peptidase [Bacteroidaceae bacterium]|jgi:hypothetical protein